MRRSTQNGTHLARGELDGARIIGRKVVDLMVANHLASFASPYYCFGSGHGFELGVEVRLDEGLAGKLGTSGTFGWNGNNLLPYLIRLKG